MAMYMYVIVVVPATESILDQVSTAPDFILPH